jgi:hypothetical protein
MKTETIVRASLVVITLLLLWTTLMWQNTISIVDTQKKTIDSLTSLSDSIRDEDFIKSVELGRHELTREYFFDRHKDLQLEYENYLNHETE